jgi:hypothetical protein
MATFTQIKNYRIKLNDPSGTRSIIQVANAAALPAVPKKGATYYALDTEYYWQCDLLSGAASTDYYQPEMYLDDSQIEDWLDTYLTETEALIQGVKAIIFKLGSEIRIKRNQAGADSTEFTGLIEALTYYKGLLALLEKDLNTANGTACGTMVQTKTPEIAGGEI